MKSIVVVMRVSVSFIVLSLSGCGASTDLTSQANPEYVGHTYRKIMVEADIADLKYRRKTESEFCDRIQDKTTSNCVQSAAVFFPGQTYTLDEVQARLAAQQIDAILVVQASTGTSSTYLPPTIYSSGSASVYGNTMSSQSTTQVIGGGRITKP